MSETLDFEFVITKESDFVSADWTGSVWPEGDVEDGWVITEIESSFLVVSRSVGFDVSHAILRFDTSWLATTMLEVEGKLHLTVLNWEDTEDMDIHGAWFYDKPDNFFLNPFNTDDELFEPFPLSDVSSTDYERITIELTNVRDKMIWGATTGIILWCGQNEPEDHNSFRIASAAFAGEGQGPLLEIKLGCSDPDDSDVDEEELIDDEQQRRRDRLPAHALDAMLLQHPQSRSRMKAKVRPDDHV